MSKLLDKLVRANGLEKDSWKAEQEADAELGEVTLGDLSDIPIPDKINTWLEDDATRLVYQAAYAKARASGLSEAQAISDACGVIASTGTRGVNGKWSVTGSLDAFTESPDQGRTWANPVRPTDVPTASSMKAAGLSPQAAGVLSAFKKAQGVFRK